MHLRINPDSLRDVDKLAQLLNNAAQNTPPDGGFGRAREFLAELQTAFPGELPPVIGRLLP